MLLKKCLVEFLGTFFLVLTIGCSVFSNSGNTTFAPLAIGIVLAVMVYAGGHVSGGHYNPAVSLAALMRGALPMADFVPYVLSQLVGGVGAAFLVKYLVAIPASETTFSLIPMLICEFLFTFALCWVVLQVATSKDNSPNSFFGLAIGLTVFVGAIATAGTCYGAFNPAAALGLFIMGFTKGSLILYTVLANFVGGIVAALMYKATTCEEQR